MRKIGLFTLGIFFYLITLTPSAFAQTYKQNFDNYFASKLGDYQNKVTVVVGCSEGILYEYDYGYNANSMVAVQSISKWLTSAIIMTLVEEGKFGLDDKVGQHIPSWNANGKQNVTIRQTLDHTSRIVDGTIWDSSSNYTLEQAVDALATSTTLQPNAGFSYGSTSYKVAARVAEIREGKSWATIFSERMKTVCGMGNSVYTPTAVNNPATGRGLVTSRTEYSNFLRMILRYGLHNTTRVMDSASVARIAKYSSESSPFSLYGLGVWREDTLANGVAQLTMHPGVDGALAWVDRTKGHFGLIITSAGQDATYSISQAFRQMAKDQIPSNTCPSGPQPTCDFALTAGNSNPNPAGGSSLNLTYNCSGSNCGGATFAWSGNGISGNQTTKPITAPTTPGTYVYQIAANKSGCAQQTATTSITVPTQGGGGTGCVVNKVRLQFRNSPDCCYERLVGAKIQGSNNGGSSWTDLYTFTGNGNGTMQDFTFSNTTSYSSARFVASSTGWGELRELEFYNSTTKLTGTTFGTDNYANAFDGNAATEWHAPSTPGPNNYAGMNFTGCSAPVSCDLNVTAAGNPTVTTPGGSIVLSYLCSGANCNTATFAWSGNGISGNEPSKTITVPGAAGTYTYTITATKSGCANKSANVNVTVNPSSGGTGCTVNKVRLKFRQSGECCMDRLPGAKIQGSNNGTTWTDLYTFTTNGTGSMQDYTFTNTTAYSSVRFQASATGWGELYELEFYKGTAKLTGTAFGVGNYANAFDGNLSTDWQVSSNPGTHNYAGLSNLGNCGGSPLTLDMVNPDELNKKLTLMVSPNPSSGILNAGFYLARGSKATIVINDLQGRTIYRQGITGNGKHNEKIYLVNKSSGTFILRLETPTGVEVRKINIAR